MENKELNFCELLKNQIGETFYTTVYGDVVLKDVNKCTLIVRPVNDLSDEIIKSSGKLYVAGEVVIYPDKEQRDWSIWINEHVDYHIVCGRLFERGGYIQSENNITEFVYADEPNTANPFLCTSEKQLRKLEALNKLMNVQRYIEGDYRPNWDNSFIDKYTLCFEEDKVIKIGREEEDNYGCVYFSSKENAQRAIKILGEDTIKVALTTDY